MSLVSDIVDRAFLPQEEEEDPLRPTAQPTPTSSLVSSLVERAMASGAAETSAPEPTEQLQEIGLLPRIAATGARVLVPLAGAAAAGLAAAPSGPGSLLAAMAGYAAGGAAGELAGQAIERAAGGRPEGIDKSEVATEAALAAAGGPFSRIRLAAEAARPIASLGRRLRPALTGAGEGALFGGVGEQARSLVERGEFADAETTALGAITGGVLGGGIGAATAGRGQVPGRGKQMDLPERPTREYLEYVASHPAQAKGFSHGQIDPDIGFAKSLVDPETGTQWVGKAGEDHSSLLRRLPDDVKERYLGAIDPEGKPHPWHQYTDIQGRVTKDVPDVFGAQDAFKNAPGVSPAPRPDPYLRGQSTYTLAHALEVDDTSREVIRKAIPEVNLLSPEMLHGMVDELVRNPAALKEGLENTASFKGLYRLNRQVAEALDGRLIDAPQAEAILKATGQSYEGIRRTASAYGMGLNEFSRLRKALDKAITDNIGLAEKYGLRKIPGDLLRLRRSLLVTQFSTAVRNAISQTARYGFEGIVQTIQGAMGDKQAAETAQLLGRNFFRTNKSIRADIKTIDDAIPGALAQLARAKEDYAGTQRKLFGLVSEQRVLNGANWMNLHLNQFLDDHIRAKTFHSFFGPAMRARGLDERALFADPKKFTSGLTPAQRLALGEASEEAIFRAQEVSFAEPAQNMVFRGLSDLVNRFPIFTLATPFPRFMGSSFRFITQHNPAGLLRAFSPDVAGDPKKLAEAYARAVAGTSMLAAGFAAREMLGGDKGTELKVPGKDQVVDMRSFYPLSFYITLADVVDKLANGKSIGQLPFEEIRESFFALGRFSDSVPNSIQLLIGKGDIQGFQANVEAIAGDFLGGFAVGLRTPKDIIEGLRGSPRSVDKKSTQQGRVFGSLAESVPGMAELGDFPQVINPATGKDVADNAPVKFMGVNVPSSIFRQVSGLNIRDRIPVESYLRSLEIDPFKTVGSLQVDPRSEMPGAENAQTKERNLTRTFMGPLLAARLAPRLESLKALPNKLIQRDIVRGIIQDAQEDARTRARIQLRQLDPRTLLLIEGSKRDTGRRSRLERGRARRQLSTRFGIPNPDENLGY